MGQSMPLIPVNEPGIKRPACRLATYQPVNRSGEHNQTLELIRHTRTPFRSPSLPSPPRFHCSVRAWTIR